MGLKVVKGLEILSKEQAKSRYGDDTSDLVVFGDKSLKINEVGLIILRGLMDGKNRRHIVDNICGNFAVDRQTVESDYDIFIKELLERGVLKKTLFS